ncbi:cAMP-phosphodiesterase D [Trypanosoma conorhini]|uniref:Phosphodiesterase n=1 Tax=Trypanosoma conorhini TaxID=83891 RepID=A0A3S5IUL0_9TRYP|nr:cAMP-phosphodiesterase D [Trypanosoma conorhini]RNF26517.1 cAMP-phosphodiesterase D [Trypanosoma conorhini]
MGFGATKELRRLPPADVDTSLGSQPLKLEGALVKNLEGTPVLRMPGKYKYIKEPGAVVMDDCQGIGGGGGTAASVGVLILFCAARTDKLTVSYLQNSTGAIYAKSMTDRELLESKEAAGISVSWGHFFKSLASDVLKSKAVVKSSKLNTKDVCFQIVNSKEPNVKYDYAWELVMVSGTGPAADQRATFEYFVEPMTCMLQVRRRASAETTRGNTMERLECDYAVKMAHLRQCNAKVEEMLKTVKPLREEASITSAKTMNLSLEAKSLERKLYMLCSGQVHKHPLDILYERGGAQYFRHVQQAEDYYPIEEKVDQGILACIRAAFPLASGVTLDGIGSVLDRAELRSQLSDSSHQLVREMFDIFTGVDRWDYDTIQLELLTGGSALFFTTYMLLYKLDLVAHFRLDDAVLQRFLLGVQAGYHPNPYHNSMHAADVTHINYYIMMLAGLKEKCQLSKEEVLAGVLAGAVHDFDHPGLNNNFHTRTNAYLSTLYNDRSILENHHVACVFELILNPTYNVFAPLSREQMQVVRETMIEMVLATDMGNHGRIFKRFQLRMTETNDWHSSKEDVRLALSISVKMADISNCARPNYIYAEWARLISREFFNQGDAEAACGLPISPFMDRTKEVVDFPKGQISFMMYIVVPMVEALSEFLPSLRFALQHCSENKEAWQNYQKEHS